MESTNSGSSQSSSSGDNEEYDSRGESISSFFNLPPPHPPPPPPPPPTPPTTTTIDATLQLHHPSSSSIFDPLSPYLASFPFPPPPEPNSLSLDSTWPKGIQMSSSSSYSTYTTPGAMTATRSSASVSTSPSSVQPPVKADRSAAAPRGSKKRSRASRRAPTTVLATDTSNFRAMVQQFTGFPTPPFASSSPFPRPRLDLFNTGAAAVPTYLLRPFPQKMPTASFAPMASSSSSTSSALEAIASFARGALSNINIPLNSSSATCSSSRATSNSTGKCQLSIFDAQHSKPLDDMQSLLQSQTGPKYNSHSLPTFEGRPQGPSDYTMGGLGRLIATEGTKSADRADALPDWVDESGQENAEQARVKAVFRNYGTQS